MSLLFFYIFLFVVIYLFLNILEFTDTPIGYKLFGYKYHSRSSTSLSTSVMRNPKGPTGPNIKCKSQILQLFKKNILNSLYIIFLIYIFYFLRECRRRKAAGESGPCSKAGPTGGAETAMEAKPD